MTKISYSGYRFPPEIIHQAIWLYLRFTLSFRDVEDLLAERGIAISYETVRRWVNHFGPIIAAELRKRRPKPHSIWHLDEVYLKIDGCMVYLLARRRRRGRGSGRAGPVQAQQARRVETDAQASKFVASPATATYLAADPFLKSGMPNNQSGRFRSAFVDLAGILEGVRIHVV
jgi:hypothetical protein